MSMSKTCGKPVKPTSLDLEYCEVGDEGAMHMAVCLRANATLTRLNLCHNHISDVGALQAVLPPQCRLYV